MPTTQAQLAAITAALAYPDKDDRRKALKALVEPVVKNLTQGDLDNIHAGLTKHGHKSRAQHSYIRDLLGLNAGICIAAGVIGANDIFHNLIDHGTDYGEWRKWCSIKGYQSEWQLEIERTPGPNVVYRDPNIAAITTNILTYLPPASSASASTSVPQGAQIYVSNLKTALDTYDALRLATNGAPENNILNAMEGHGLPVATRKALASILANRTTVPTATAAGATMLPNYEHMLRALGAEQPVEAPATASAAPAPSPAQIPAAILSPLNSLLNSAGLPTVDVIAKHLKTGAEAVKEVESLKKRIATLPVVASVNIAANTTLGIPDGKSKIVNASDVFDFLPDHDRKLIAFDVPAFDWDAPHPNVPVVDPNYRFRIKSLRQVLYALAHNKRLWVHGMTGTGKTTLVEQVCARLHWPYMRLNFDSEITRMDLVGRDSLVPDGNGGVVSKFIDGLLIQAMTSPTVLLLDEPTLMKPDVAYVFQRPLEPNGHLVVTEDGGRMVIPHPLFRIFGADNTVGQGDEKGIYAGVRPQSGAWMNRFNSFVEVPYLTRAEEEGLLLARLPGLAHADAKRIAQYAHEHREAFSRGELLIPVSPRNTIDVAEQYLFFSAIGDANALDAAMQAVILDRCASADAAVVKGLIDRVLRNAT